MKRERRPTTAYLHELSDLTRKLPVEPIDKIIDLLRAARREGRHVFLLGNGGSAATASHLVNDLAKLTIEPNVPRLRAIALTDNVPLVTAWANDSVYEAIFAEQLDNFVSPGDVVIGFSTSGNSPNVVRALTLAKARGARTVAFTGRSGGALKAVAEVCFMVPSESTQLIEDVHLAAGHCVVRGLLGADGGGEASC